MKVLVVAAHPDDEVLGCGGTIARRARQGNAVHVAILGEGVTSRFASREQAASDDLAALRADSRKAADLLGALGLSFHGLPDNRFDTVPLLEVVKIIEQLVADNKPDVVYTHHGGDLNIDHAVTHRAVLTATRPTVGHCVRELYAFEVASSTEWAFQQVAPVFRPNTFVDISETLDVKCQAMALYESERREFPHPRSDEALRAAALRWGSVVGCAAAEAFELIRAVR